MLRWCIRRITSRFSFTSKQQMDGTNLNTSNRTMSPNIRACFWLDNKRLVPKALSSTEPKTRGLVLKVGSETRKPTKQVRNEPGGPGVQLRDVQQMLVGVYVYLWACGCNFIHSFVYLMEHGRSRGLMSTWKRSRAESRRRGKEFHLKCECLSAGLPEVRRSDEDVASSAPSLALFWSTQRKVTRSGTQRTQCLR